MSIKVHYLHSHLDRYPKNLEDYSESRVRGYLHNGKKDTKEDGTPT